MSIETPALGVAHDAGEGGGEQEGPGLHIARVFGRGVVHAFYRAGAVPDEVGLNQEAEFGPDPAEPGSQRSGRVC